MPDELEIAHPASESRADSLEAGGLETTYTPRELAAELGYTNESRPGQIVRVYVRMKYPEHPPHERWQLDEAQADDVRANVQRSW